MLLWHRELWLIDHGAALYFHYNWANWEKTILNPFTPIKNHVLLSKASQLEEVNVIFKSLLTVNKIQEIINLIPDDWLDWNEVNETPQSIKNIYIQFLTERIKHSEIFVKEAQDARKMLI
jgi:hypothetical protein